MAKKEGFDAHQALYRKYRSRSLDEIVGQSQVTEILRRSLAQGKIAHAYLLTGPKGTGKTSIARILAHEINQLPYDGEGSHLDIIEIDAASNNGVEDVRELRDKVQLAPIAAAKKVYVIDEVHMLSKPAFNALLKTLEEPPSHIVFILATTDLHKVPATIISRTQHFSFHSISLNDIVAQLKRIAVSEGIKISDEAILAIASRGDGSMRNSISLLDQMSSFADSKEGITLQLVETSLGLAPSDAVNELLEAVTDRDVPGVINRLDELEKRGIQFTVLADQLVQAVRAQLGERPQLVHLLDALLSVPSSPQPQLKLLTVLVGAIKPKTAATSVARPLAVMIEKPLPQVAQKPRPVTSTNQAPKPQDPVKEKPTAKNKKKALEPINLDWSQLLECTREHFVAVYSVLNKCTYDLNGSELTIYAGRKFNKTKLDEPKYSAQLHDALAKIGVENVTIVTLPTVKPPTDKKVAKITELMGGGQEITLDEESK